MAPTYPMSALIEEIIFSIVNPFAFAFHASKRRFIFKNGSILEIKSAEDPEKLVAFGIDYFWVDEAAMIKRRAWENLTTRWKAGGGKLKGWITTTPRGFNWVYQIFVDPATRWKDSYFQIARSIDNPLFPKEDFERARRELPEQFFRERYLGEFVKFSGLVYPEFSMVDHVVESLNVSKEWRRFGGIDFGYNNPFVCLWIAEHDGVLYVYKELYRRYLKPSDYISILKADPLPVYYADPSAAAEIAEMRAAGLKVLPARKLPVMQGIERVAGMLKSKRLKVLSSCVNIIKEFESYRFPEAKEGQEARDHPLKVDDHAMDALRYAVVSYERGSIEEFVVEPEPEIRRPLSGVGGFGRGSRLFGRELL